jgi:protein phosphatase
VSAGEISAEEAASHPDRNALISAVTGDDLDLVDLPRRPFALKPKDQILLASDGLLTLSEREIAAVLKDASAASSPCQPLLEEVMSRRHPQQDNATVLWAKRPTPDSDKLFWWQLWARNTLLASALAMLAFPGVR